ncbi:MAG: biotin/lipoyl-containing protein [bacterium]
MPGADGGLDITATWEDVPHFARYRPSLPSVDPGASALPSFGEAGVLELGEVLLPIQWDAEGNRRWLTLRGRHVFFQAEDPAFTTGRAPAGEEAAERLRAPLPGKVLKVEVGEGDEVTSEQVLLVLEAMKMEHKVTAPFAGRVKRILFGEGDLVNRDDQLIELEEEGR